MNLDPAKIRLHLEKTQAPSARTCPPLPGIKHRKVQSAAVLMPLVQDGSEWKLLFIKRTHHEHDRHSGQIAFPGGRADMNDPSLLSTALREAKEEIGVDPKDVEILGRSCSITTVTDYEVNPFVGLLPWPYQLELSLDEVVKTLLIPIDWLIDPQNYKTRSWQSRSAPGRDYPVIFYEEYKGEILWGATAQIVMDFLELTELISGS
jgi:8-oxo-dGTP pyrophosphatase MutT (NUDIX family)